MCEATWLFARGMELIMLPHLVSFNIQTNNWTALVEQASLLLDLIRTIKNTIFQFIIILIEAPNDLNNFPLIRDRSRCHLLKQTLFL
jgi:hypothetical protein